MWMPCTKCEHYIACWRQKDYHTPEKPCEAFKQYKPNPSGNFNKWVIINNNDEDKI